MANTINILSTKKLLPKQKQLLLDANFEIIEADFIEINIKNFELTNVNDNLIFTSQNAVESVLENAQSGKGKDPYGYRSEFIRLVEKSRLLWGELN